MSHLSRARGAGGDKASAPLKAGTGVQRDITALEGVEQRSAKTHNSYFEYHQPKYRLPAKL